MDCLIAGGGIGGLTAALSLRAAGVDARVVEAAGELAPIGVGINLLPNAVRELFELGLEDRLSSVGVETGELVFCDDHGRPLWRDRRGRAGGHRWPQLSIHRGALQMLLADAVRERLGPGALRTGLILERFEDQGDRVAVELRERSTGRVVGETADVLIGADGLHSAVRAQLHPDEGLPLWNGVHMWRGAAEAPAFLGGNTMIASVGLGGRARLIAYPISAGGQTGGPALVNWVAEVKLGGVLDTPPDWRREGSLEELLPHYAGWELPWLDAAALFRASPTIWWYPMVDRDPLDRWSGGRVTLLGDAAHPMYPTGSNGATQAIVDARVLAWNLATQGDAVAGLAAYEETRRPQTSAVVLASRRLGAPGQMEAYKRAAGFDVETLNQRPSWTVTH